MRKGVRMWIFYDTNEELQPFGPIDAAHWRNANKVGVKQFNKLFVQQPHFRACVPSVFFKDGCKIPSL